MKNFLKLSSRFMNHRFKTRICWTLCLLFFALSITGCGLYHADTPAFTVPNVRILHSKQGETIGSEGETEMESKDFVMKEIESYHNNIKQLGSSIEEQAESTSADIKEKVKQIQKETLGEYFLDNSETETTYFHE